MKRIVAKVESYTDREGNAKNRWQEIGVILSNENGEYVLIDPMVNTAGAFMLQRIEQQRQGGKVGDKLMCSIFDDDRGGPGPSTDDTHSHEIPF